MEDLFATFGIHWKLLLIQAVNFGVLLFALTYFLYSPVLKAIDDRRTKIAQGVQAAENAEKSLAEARSKSDDIVGQGTREAESLVSNARTRASEVGDQLVKTAESKAQNILKDASARAEEVKRQALAESEKEIAKAAVLAAEKILRDKHA